MVPSNLSRVGENNATGGRKGRVAIKRPADVPRRQRGGGDSSTPSRGEDRLHTQLVMSRGFQLGVFSGILNVAL